MWAWLMAQGYENNPDYKGCKLVLPASDRQIQDALDQARVTERDSYRIADLGDCGYVLKKYLNLSDCKIEEINYIARHMQQITEEEDHIYDEMISLKITDEIKTLPVGVFIDAFANMNKMEFHPGVYDDKSLGEIALEAQMMPWMEQIPDEALPFLSYEKIGECIRKQENGFYSQDGYYSISVSEWEEIHNTVSLENTDRESSIFSVEMEDQEAGISLWIKLPCSEKTLEKACLALRVEDMNAGEILSVRCFIPILDQLSYGDMVFSYLNEMAGKINRMSREQLVKYKAVLEYSECKTAEEAFSLIDMLDQYDFCQRPINLAELGREYFVKFGIAPGKLKLQDGDYAWYIEAKLNGVNMKKTRYGIVHKKMDQKQEQEMENTALQMIFG